MKSRKIVPGLTHDYYRFLKQILMKFKRLEGYANFFRVSGGLKLSESSLLNIVLGESILWRKQADHLSLENLSRHDKNMRETVRADRYEFGRSA